MTDTQRRPGVPPNRQEAMTKTPRFAEAPNECPMDATYDAGRLTVRAFPPEDANAEYRAECEMWARLACRDWFHSYEDANVHLVRLGVRERVFEGQS